MLSFYQGPMKVSEEMINEWICNFLSRQGGFVTRIAPSGFFKNGAMVKHRSVFIRRGVPDILYWRDDKAYAFEVKTPTAYKYAIKHYDRIKNTPKLKLNKMQIHLQEQIHILEQLKIQGVHASFVCGVEQVKLILADHAK